MPERVDHRSRLFFFVLKKVAHEWHTEVLKSLETLENKGFVLVRLVGLEPTPLKGSSHARALFYKAFQLSSLYLKDANLPLFSPKVAQKWHKLFATRHKKKHLRADSEVCVIDRYFKGNIRDGGHNIAERAEGLPLDRVNVVGDSMSLLRPIRLP